MEACILSLSYRIIGVNESYLGEEVVRMMLTTPLCAHFHTSNASWSISLVSNTFDYYRCDSYCFFLWFNIQRAQEIGREFNEFMNKESFTADFTNLY